MNPEITLNGHAHTFGEWIKEDAMWVRRCRGEVPVAAGPEQSAGHAILHLARVNPFTSDSMWCRVDAVFHIDLDRADARVVRLSDGAEMTGRAREDALDVAEDAFARAIEKTGATVHILHPRPRP